MSLAQKMVSGEICRICQFPLAPPYPGHSRICVECFDESDWMEEWERIVGPTPLDPNIEWGDDR
jgi:hypothetical protein